MKYFFITGTSRGLGEDVARQLIAEDNYIFCIARQQNQQLVEMAQNKQNRLKNVAFDLNELTELESMLEGLFAGIDLETAEGFYLINNAGTLDPIKPVGIAESEAVIRNINVNQLAPMLLTSAFVRLTKTVKCQRRVVNVSSGAGRKPYEGWSSYCAAKAAIDMFTRCVALESQLEENPTEIVAFGPGVMDTAMQAGIRNTNTADFVQLQKFLDLKKDGKLLTPELVAGVLIKLLLADNFPQGEYIDVYSLMA